MNRVLHAQLVDGGKKLKVENIRNSSCQAQLPYANLLGNSFELTKDE